MCKDSKQTISANLNFFLRSYTGIMLFSVWVIYRENSIIIPIAWILFFIVWGNFGTALYLFIAALRSGGNIKQLLLGARHYDRD